MIGGLLLILLGIAGAMQAPVWAVPVVALMIAGICGTAPFLRRRMSGPVVWGVIALASAVAYGIGHFAGQALIG